VNACPFPPGEPKPEAMEHAPRRINPRALLNRRSLALTLAFFALVALYVYGSPGMSSNTESLLNQKNFVISLSLYTYVSVMLTHFIKLYKKKQKIR